MACHKENFKNLTLVKFLTGLIPLYIFLFALFVNSNLSQAAKLGDGTWAQSANPGTTTVSFTNGATTLQSGYKIVLTFPGTAAISQAGTNIAVTGSTTPTRSNNAVDNTITITLDGTIDAATTATITMTDGLTSYTSSTYAQESLAINTQTGANTPVDFGVAIKTNSNQTTITTQVPLFVNIAVNTTAINLGTLSTSSINTSNQTYTINSNNRTGVTLRITADGLLRDGFGNNINDVGDGTVTAGSEEYGIGISNVTSMTIEAPYDSGDNPLPLAPANIASTTTEISNGSFRVNYSASITGTTIAGSYTQVVTMTVASNA